MMMMMMNYNRGADLVKLSESSVSDANVHVRAVRRYRESRHGAFVRHQIDELPGRHLKNPDLIGVRGRHERQLVVRGDDDVTDR